MVIRKKMHLVIALTFSTGSLLLIENANAHESYPGKWVSNNGTSQPATASSTSKKSQIPTSSGLSLYKLPNNIVLGEKIIRVDLGTSQKMSIGPSTSATNSNRLAGKNADVVTFTKDKRSNTLRLVTGPLEDTTNEIPATQRDENYYAERCINWISTRGRSLGILVSSSDLKIEPDATLISDDVQFINFRVYRNGLQIQEGNIDCRFKQGQLYQVQNKSFSEAVLVEDDLPQDSVKSPLLALGTSIDNGQLNSIKQNSAGQKLRVVQTESGYNLVKVYELKSALENGTPVKIQFTNDGSVFEVKSEVHNAAGKVEAEIYEHSYLQKPETSPVGYIKGVGQTTVNGTAKTKSTWTTNSDGEFKITGELEPAIPSIDGKFPSIYGEYVNVLTEQPSDLSFKANNDNGDWTISFVKNSENKEYDDFAMAQLMAFVHINRVVDKALEQLSNPKPPRWFRHPLTVNTNINRTCNAEWNGQSIDLFAAGSDEKDSSLECGNTALIADVIYHEWGHGLDHGTGGIEDAAFSEGFGDIVAYIMTGSPKLAKGFFLNSDKGLRDMSKNKVYPKDQGEAHAEGGIISSTFFDLAQELKKLEGAKNAQKLMEKFTFKMIPTAHTYLEVYDVLLTLDSVSAKEAPDASPHYCVINKVFAKHGLTEVDSECSN